MPVAALEVKKDIIGEKYYASRNYNDLSHTYTSGSNRAQLDWNMTLRQRRKNFGMKTGQESKSRSAPNLHETERKANRPPDEDLMHQDGPYHSTTETVGRYQNFASSAHMLQSLKRVSSGSAHTIDWQLNLRGGCHGLPDHQWRRHHTRSQPSFDMMKENCSRDNEEYRYSHITPQNPYKFDRSAGALPIETVRDDPINFKRSPGCEGTQVGQWEHLISHRRYGHKSRRQLGHETTLREHKKDEALGGTRIEDTRSDGCIVEMLGKKKWTDGLSHDPMSYPPPDGDHKLYHLSRTRILPEPDEENREMRKNKQIRLDANISYEHTGKRKKHEKREDT
jgi:hypothetical protein|mmetsp:Transcript_83489/g.131948  ORF Transcript_83489/g.131948 Transcript_83489/m.131948 type:complete len:337 (-) Transcript_83489:194-1204(-)|eukprot:CAMPEP_0169119520 /NCGR_PEP_ID=MMETSP1015-20121227/31605_1 /TAXON_ID=342587 /ORGANISM="Karlodinium micrum, Strain CCMP2283" /LENGTH=336 /DNA_ID=CAMNT_0009182415 /DNA_START=41 /DNA_END=1051 /DNA_ORIENTATION=-